MKILYMAKTPLAGVCEKMARTVNEYLRPEHEARVCSAGPGRHAWYVREPKKLVPRFSIKDEAHVKACVEWADVIHCMANVGVRSPWFAKMDRARLLKNKTWVYQWHGAQIWPFERVWQPEDYPSVKFIHIGQGWLQTQPKFFGPFIRDQGLRVVPNIITGDDLAHRPMPWGVRLNRAAYSPSQQNESAVNRKGVNITLTALRGTRYDLISKVDFERCLLRKQKCKLGIDEVVTPMYHLSGLEFLAQGTPCICSATPETEANLTVATGCDRFPFIKATPDTLASVIKEYWLLSDEEQQAAGAAAREWFDKFYHPKILINRYIEVYGGV